MSWTSFGAGHVRGDGETLAVVLHGGPGLSDYTESLADEVYAAGDGAFRVGRYEQRTDEPLTVAQLVDDFVAFVEQLGDGRTVVVGHSWGGHLAMHIAVARPDLVRALVLVDSLGAIGDGGSGTMQEVIGNRIGPDAVARRQALQESGLPIEELGIEELKIIWPGYFKDPSAAPPLPPIDYHLAAAAAIGADAFRMLADGFLEKALPALDIPSLHLIAAHSPIDPAANEKTAALMKGAVVEILDTGHFPWLEEPGLIEAAVRRFRIG